MNEILSYCIVQVTRTGSFPQEYLRLAYHYLHVEHAMEHLDWAKKKFVDQSKEKYPELSLIGIEIRNVCWNETQHRNDPPIGRFFLPPGEKIPAEGHTFKSI